jgi:hypothetical protein
MTTQAETALEENSVALEGLDTSALAEKSAVDLCRLYEQSKDTLEALLPWLEKIPGWPRRIAKVIRVLMAIADKLCPAAG